MLIRPELLAVGLGDYDRLTTYHRPGSREDVSRLLKAHGFVRAWTVPDGEPIYVCTAEWRKDERRRFVPVLGMQSWLLEWSSYPLGFVRASFGLRTRSWYCQAPYSGAAPPRELNLSALPPLWLAALIVWTMFAYDIRGDVRACREPEARDAPWLSDVGVAGGRAARHWQEAR
jgi:hypothetical protein